VNVSDTEPRPATVADPTLLDRCRTQWQFGDWSSLCALSEAQIREHPDRAKLALLAAAGHQQHGDMQLSRRWSEQALAWGCERKLLAQILVAGVYNTLARAAAAAGDEPRALSHFRQAVRGSGGDERLLVQVRSVREVARMGLLDDAARAVKRELGELTSTTSGRALSMHDPRVSVLATQLELVQHEIRLATQRSAAGTAIAGSAPVLSEQSAGGSTDVEAWRSRATSQLGQDLWVLEQTGFKRNGFFVEFGATDGILLSNTYLLETAFGWQGICAEPNPRMFSMLQANRRCTVSSACIGATTGEKVAFVFADEYGCLLRDVDCDMNAHRRAGFAALPEYRAELETTSLHDLLVSLGAPHKIDYISIDTEGSELSILEAFPFDRWQVHCLTVEHNFTDAREKIHQLLAGHGYRRVEAQHDDWYVLDRST
jgi:FkbM family methyltransferase